ncbi:helix-turn-helix domain-containing protein [Saccharopolyspora tripterygii]
MTRRLGELGTALREWRGRLAPGDVGFPSGSLRRAKGLRREELALLAGISVDYVVRLEQGRANPSQQVVGALAAALRLTGSERDHLFALAGLGRPTSGRSTPQLTPSLQRLLDQLRGIPVGVFDAGWTLTTWNRLYAALFGDPAALSDRERNVVWAHYAGLPTRVRSDPALTAMFEEVTAAGLRSAAARFPADVQLRTLLDELRGFPRFAEVWNARRVGEHVAHSKIVDHPEIGPVQVDCDVLEVPASDLRLVAYTTPDDDVAERLRLLEAVGAGTLS